MEEQISYRGHTINIIRDYDGGHDRELDHPNSYGNGEWKHGPNHECPNGECWQWISIWLSDYSDDLHAGFDGPEEFYKYFDEEEWVIMTVRGYSHSGWAFSTSHAGQFSDPWDSGMAGLVAIRKDLPKGLENKTPAEWASHTVDHFEAWFNGYYYGYQVEGPVSDDSCWGYLCIDHNLDYMISDAKSNIDAEINYARKQRFDKLKKLIKGKCPLWRRKSIISDFRVSL